MSERLRIIKKKFEIVGIADETSLSAIEPIEQGGLTVENKEDLENLVEPPLLEACQFLFDKHIRTIFSSANRYNIESGKVYITIDYEKLSPVNKKIAESIGGEIHMAHGSIPTQAINVEIPVDNQTKVGDIRKKAAELVGKFEQQ